MRVQPRYHVGLIAVVVYSVLVVAAWGLLGVDYATISSTTENVVRGIVVPVGIGRSSWPASPRGCARGGRRCANPTASRRGGRSSSRP